MKKLKGLPDLARSAKFLKISCELENIAPVSMIGIAINQGLREGRIREIIAMIRGMAEDNRPMIEEILGASLLSEIETL